MKYFIIWFSIVSIFAVVVFLLRGGLNTYSLMSNLVCVPLTDPKTRPKNLMDDWYINHIEELSHCLDAVEYISRYDYLENTFWEYVKEPEKNLELQKNIIAVCYDKYSDCWYVRCSNMLLHFVCRYDFLPEVKETIAQDRERYEEVIRIYNRWHNGTNGISMQKEKGV